jgi:hypothetical protein
MMVKVMMMTKRDDQVIQRRKGKREKQKPSIDQGKSIK